MATLACHTVAMAAMAALLLPMMPGGPTTDDAARVAAIAAQPWRWRAGWATWGITAASDVALGLALVGWARVPRVRAWAALLLVCAAVVPDQAAQLRWVTRGVDLARAGDLGAYLAFERDVFRLTGAWAALLYTAASVAWCACFAAAGAWSRGLARLSVPLFVVFAAAAAAPLLPADVGVSPATVAGGNALAFLGLEVWLLLLLEHTARLARPDAPHGRWAPWRAPRSSALSGALDAAANSRALRRLLGLLPVPRFRSDIRDVVYVSYLVPAGRLATLVPEGLELQRLGPGGEWAMFSFLTYRHGHFGPAVAGPLRRLFPSPVQTNWRTYVRDPRTGREGIYFVTNAVTTRLHALGGRLMSEAPMHLLAHGEVTRAADGAMRVRVDPGAGSGPDAELDLAPTAALTLPDSWRVCFADARAMLAYCVPQDRAMTTEPWRACTTREEIALGIPLDACEPLAGTVRSRAASALVGDAEPVCFRVARVRFALEGEVRDAWTSPAARRARATTAAMLLGLALGALGCRSGAEQAASGPGADASVDASADAPAACTTLFGAPNEATGLGPDQCRPQCGCGPDAFVPPAYDAAFVESLVTDFALATPYPPLASDPYEAGAPPPADPPGTVCAVLEQADAGGPPRLYTLVTYPSEAAAADAGARVTHFGHCGVCSTLANLAVYVRNTDLTAPVRTCGLQTGPDGGSDDVGCLEQLGFDLPCAQIWAYDTAHTRDVCLATCIADIKEPYNLPDGAINDCLECDEVQSGPVFQAVAGRTRRNSGIPNAICRPCSQVQPLVHSY